MKSRGPVVGPWGARRKQKPRSRDDLQDGAAIAAIQLPIMSKDRSSLAAALDVVNLRCLDPRQSRRQFGNWTRSPRFSLPTPSAA
jgi:hypothetical protein